MACGLRWREIATLRWSDFDADGRSLTVRARHREGKTDAARAGAGVPRGRVEAAPGHPRGEPPKGRDGLTTSSSPPRLCRSGSPPFRQRHRRPSAPSKLAAKWQWAAEARRSASGAQWPGETRTPTKPVVSIGVHSARATGLEPATTRSTVWCANQLRYAPWERRRARPPEAAAILGPEDEANKGRAGRESVAGIR